MATATRTAHPAGTTAADPLPGPVRVYFTQPQPPAPAIYCWVTQRQLTPQGVSTVTTRIKR